MKNVRRIRRNRALRSVVVLAFVALAWCGAIATARAADETHWLTPSRHARDRNALYEAGIPARGLPPDTGTRAGDRARLVREGAVLYGVHCSTCHGANLAGTPGVPSLLEAGGAAVDFYMTTGRMPLALRAKASGENNSALGRDMATGVQADHVPALFDARQTAAVDAYVDARARHVTPIPNVRVDAARLQRGRSIFENNCQACHGAAAEGATAGGGWTALPLDKASPTQIGEAIRVGPGVMPRFTTAQLSADDVDAVATYVRDLADHPQLYGGTVMQYLGPVSEGAVSAIVGVGFLFWVIYFTGTKADGRRLNELD